MIRPFPNRSFRTALILSSLIIVALAGGLTYWFVFKDNERSKSEAERAAIAMLVRLGAGVQGIEDVNIGPRGFMVRLKKEHLSNSGHVNAEVMDQLQVLENLVVQVRETQISNDGLVPLVRLPNLAGLDLYNTGITDNGLRHLATAPRLKLLGLKWTRLTDSGLKHLGGLHDLRILYLNGTSITDQGLKHISGLTELTALNLSFTLVTDAGLDHLLGLGNLEFLGLDKTLVSDAGLQHLTVLAKLKYLNVVETGITDEFVEAFKQTNPDCDVLL